ncbi:putative phloem protein [Helianthus debilis subsp. tardiflorus]
MAEIVTELEITHNNYEFFQKNEEFIGKWNEQLHEYQQMIKTAEPPLNYKSEDELMDLLSKGVLFNGGKTCFWLNKKGEHCEIISIAECLGSDADSDLFSSEYKSRFAVGTYSIYTEMAFKNILKVFNKTQFLSPGITYTVNLVFKFKKKKERRCEHISLKYRLQGERENSISYLAYKRKDGWWACELYQFTCDYRIVQFQILFEDYHNQDYRRDVLQVEGIEFQPLENVEHIDEKQPISDLDSDANWEEKLPVDYEDIMKRSKNILQWTAKDEAYSIICKGFLISDDETKRGIWFSLDKNGKKYHMLSAAHIWSWKKNTIQLGDDSHIFIRTEVQSQLVSSETTYACYLVYKLPEDQSGFEAPVKLEDERCDSVDIIWYIYLTSPQTQVIRPKAGQNTHNPLNRPKIKGLPQQRNDGWIEVKIWELRAATTINMELTLGLCDKKKFSGLIIEGIEFRPI